MNGLKCKEIQLCHLRILTMFFICKFALQIFIAGRMRCTISDFLELDRQTNLLLFVADTYEVFHLTGDPGILDEVDDYVQAVFA